MKEKITSTLRKLDIIGKEVQFRIDNSETYKTWIGGFLTVLLGLISLGSIYLFGNDIIYKTKPTLLFKKFQRSDYPSITINSSNFFFAIRIVDRQGVYINDYRFFEPKLNYQYYHMNNETLMMDLIKEDNQILETCNSSHIDNHTLENEFLTTFKCALLKNYTLGGSWESSEISLLNYEVNKCTEETEKKYNIKCATEEDLFSNFTMPFFVEIKYHNYILDATNLNKPISQSLDFRSSALDYNTNKVNLYFYSESTLSTDLGYLVEDIHYDNFTQIEKLDLDFEKHTPSSSKTIFIASIFMTKLNNFYDRSYLKVQDIAATVGGFFSITYNILKILYYFYIENSLIYYYFEHLFSFYRIDDKSLVEENNQELNVIQFHTVTNVNKLNNNASKFKQNDQLKSYQAVDISSNNTPNEINSLHIKADVDIDTFEKLNLKSGNSMLTSLQNPNKKSKSAVKFENLENEVDNTDNVENMNTNIKKLKRLGTNVNLSKILTNISKPKTLIKIDEMTLWKYQFCSCFVKKETNTDTKLMNQFIYSAKAELDKRYSAVNMLALFEEFKVLKQIVLNEDQCFMLNQKGKKVITNIESNTDKQFTEAFDESERKKEHKLIAYLLKKKEDQGIEETDYLLLRSMKNEIQKRVLTQCNIK